MKRNKKGQFEKGTSRWFSSANERKNRVLMMSEWQKLKSRHTLKYNELITVKGAKLGIVASGLGYAYMREAVQVVGIEDKVSILKVGTPYPIPDELTLQLIKSFLKFWL
jgi:indolepyruvate ferredoxin oxidoreductase alpha subunit